MLAVLLAFLLLAPSHGSDEGETATEVALARLAAEQTGSSALQAVQSLRDEHAGCGEAYHPEVSFVL